MSRPAVPLGYRSMQDFLLRWHSRNAVPQAAHGFVPPADGAVPGSAGGAGAESYLRRKPAGRQGRSPSKGRDAFYERSIRSDVKTKTLHTPGEADFKPISAPRRK
jgi:hypothetical protein